ncbi:conjugative transfer system coupling protein TraD [Rhizobacter sp. LjRoot28]|uniref:conjugative transfer system coupling protein TraD n=1 Tax=Rhizobacter sp. LjRoot28 TaxID=3342309 RepID=UPI003ED0E227
MQRLNAFRRVHEARAAVAWGLAAAHCGLLYLLLHMDATLALGMTVACATLGVRRGAQAMRLWRFKIGLAGAPTAHLSCGALDRGRPALDGGLWLGWGYRWEPSHTQLCQDILKRSLVDVYAPTWLLRLNGMPARPAQAKGLSWVHGLGPEHDIVVPFASLEGHTAVLAITGALKTVLARLLVYQLAARGDTVIVLDPKGDKGLEQACRDVTTRLGQPERFAMFHPAFASRSFRFDPLSSWDRETQVASRIRLLLGPTGPDDPFMAFVMMTVTDITGAMKRLGRRVSLQALLDVVRSPERAEALAEEVLSRFLTGGQALEPVELPVAGAERSGEGPRKAGAFGSHRLAELVRRYRAQPDRPPDIEGFLAMLAVNREWFAKMVVSLTPVLARLTTGDLGALLSPDHADIEDERPIHTGRSLIEGRHVAYFGLDALSDTSVAESLAALILSDLAGTAGDLYNHERAETPAARRKVHIVCDEWGDLVCEPVIQLANKGRGAGMVLYLFGQTLSDLAVKLGDEGRAKRVLGNMNNFIVGATSDADTLDFIGRKLGETVVRRTSLTHGAGQRSEDAGLSYAANRQASMSEEAIELVPPQVLMSLPDLHYLAIVNRAQVFKGRIPVLDLGERGTEPGR